MTLGVGIHDISAEAYHADPCERPSLSSSIAHLLCSSSPAHARAAHPRLNPVFERVEEEKFDVGTVAHALLLQGDEIASVIEAKDWRTKDAKEQRELARMAGRVPLLAKDWERVKAMVEATRDQLAAFDCDPPLLVDGKPERTLVWEDEGVMCRALVDWLHDDVAAVDDLKTTVRSANPEPWTRSTMFAIGADIQVALYLRGLEVLTGRTDVEWRYVIVETQPPYELSVVSPGPDVMVMARKKVRYALAVWRRCMERGEWPGYPRRVCWADLPPWEEQRWLQKEEREAFLDERRAA